MSLQLAERFERVMSLINKGEGRSSQTKMLTELNSVPGKKFIPSTISKLLTGNSPIGPRLESELSDALEYLIRANSLSEQDIIDVPTRNLIKTNKRIDLRQSDNSQKIPSVYSGIWLGVHYPTIRMNKHETEINKDEIRTFILIYDDNKPMKRGFSIYGNSTYFTGTVDYVANKVYYYGFEKFNKNENVFMLMHDANNSSANNIAEHCGVISGIGQGGAKSGHIFSVKLYMAKINTDDDLESFRAKLQTNTSFKAGWCGRFKINRSGWKTDNSDQISRAIDSYMSIINKNTAEDVGERLFIL